MSADRLFQIMDLLLERGRMTADALAEALGVSAHTVYRDLEALSAAGIPVCTAQGKGGGIILAGDCIPGETAFTREEQRLLLHAVREFPEQSVEKALAKLAMLFRRGEESWLHADLSRLGSSGQENERFSLLRQAVRFRRAVSFVYGDPNETPHPLHILPARLVYLDRVWHLQGYDTEKESYRLFRLSRISSLAVAESTFRRRLTPPDIDPIGKIPPLFRVDAILKFPPAMAHLVFDEFSGDSIAVQADGSLMVCTEFFEDQQLYRYLLSFGPGMEVIAPLRLREQIARLADEISRFNAPIVLLGEGSCE